MRHLQSNNPSYDGEGSAAVGRGDRNRFRNAARNGDLVVSKRNQLTGVITSISTLTQSQYDALSPRDPSTLYIIVDGAAVDLDPPVFTSGAVAAAIDELSGAGQVIYTATSTDAPARVVLSQGLLGTHGVFNRRDKRRGDADR